MIGPCVARKTNMIREGEKKKKVDEKITGSINQKKTKQKKNKKTKKQNKQNNKLTGN